MLAACVSEIRLTSGNTSALDASILLWLGEHFADRAKELREAHSAGWLHFSPCKLMMTGLYYEHHQAALTKAAASFWKAACDRLDPTGSGWYVLQVPWLKFDVGEEHPSLQKRPSTPTRPPSGYGNYVKVTPVKKTVRDQSILDLYTGDFPLTASVDVAVEKAR